MTIEIYQRVKLLTDRFVSTDNVYAGSIGYVIDIYPDGNCEVEFSDANGITFAQIVTSPSELEIEKHEN